MFFVWYRDLRSDMAKVVRQLATFLERDVTEEDVQLLTENMKKEKFRFRCFLSNAINKFSFFNTFKFATM